ncbi:hypothetical protein SLA2020_107920 [Shorea laevis]
MQDGGEYVEQIDVASGVENDAEGSRKHVEQFQFGMYNETETKFHARDGIENEEEPLFDVEDLHSDVDDDEVLETFLKERENHKKNQEKKEEKIRKGKAAAVATSSNIENHHEA